MYSILWVFNAKTLIGEKAVIKMCLRFTNRRACKRFRMNSKTPREGSRDPESSRWTFLHVSLPPLPSRVGHQDTLSAAGRVFESEFEGGHRRRSSFAWRGGRHRKIRRRSFVMSRTILTSGARAPPSRPFLGAGASARSPFLSPPSSLLLPYSPIITLVFGSLSALPSYIHLPTLLHFAPLTCPSPSYLFLSSATFASSLLFLPSISELLAPHPRLPPSSPPLSHLALSLPNPRAPVFGMDKWAI